MLLPIKIVSYAHFFGRRGRQHSLAIRRNEYMARPNPSNKVEEVLRGTSAKSLLSRWKCILVRISVNTNFYRASTNTVYENYLFP